MFSIMGNIKKGAPGPGAYNIEDHKSNVAYSIRTRTNIFGFILFFYQTNVA